MKEGTVVVWRCATVVALLIASLGHSNAQMPWPIQGQGQAPEGRTIVGVDMMYDSFQGIDSDRNSFGAVVWFHFSWQDDRALLAITERTSALWSAPQNCTRLCDSSGHISSGCCDNVWLPHIDLSNMVALNQDAVYKWRIWVQPTTPGSNVTNLVHWSVKVSGEFHAPMDFRAWPFEHQHLILEVQLAPSLANSVALKVGSLSFGVNTPHTKGEVVPGWFVAKTFKRTYDRSACYNASDFTTSYYTFDGTQAQFQSLEPGSWAQLSTPHPGTSTTTVQLPACQLISSAMGGPNSTVLVNPEALYQYNPQIIVFDTMVRRVKDYYLLSNILPQLLLAYMVFVTYAMERSDLESRMGVVVTLVLAASALQFTWNFPPANYLNAVQQITLASYVLYFIVAIESMIASHICRMHERRRQKQQIFAILQTGDNPGGQSMGPRWGPGFRTDASESDFADYRPTPSFAPSAAPSLLEELPEEPAQQQPRPSIGYMRQKTNLTRSAVMARANTRTSMSSDVDTGDRLADWDAGLYGAGRKAGPVGEGTEQQHQQGYGYDAGQTFAYMRATSGVPMAKQIEGSGSAMSMRASSGIKFGDVEYGMKAVPGAVTPNMPSTADKSKGKKDALPKGKSFMSKRWSSAKASTRNFQKRVSKDEAFAQLFAARMDVIFCWSVMVAYTVTVAVLMYITTQVGDHKLMLQGDKPLNM